MSLLPDWLTGYNSANADAAAAADAQLQALNAKDYGPGGKYYTPDNYAAVTAQRASEIGQGGYGTDNQRNQIDQTFTDTLDAQASSLIGGPLGIVWATIKAAIKAVPWWIWAISIVAGVIYMGGIPIAKAFFKRKAKA